MLYNNKPILRISIIYIVFRSITKTGGNGQKEDCCMKTSSDRCASQAWEANEPQCMHNQKLTDKVWKCSQLRTDVVLHRLLLTGNMRQNVMFFPDILVKTRADHD